MIVEPGQEAVLVAIEPVSLHGDRYFDVVIGDLEAPDDPERFLRARLGPEAVEGDPKAGDRVKLDGFLQTVTKIIAI